MNRIEPTEAERRNGWDADSLARYVAERNQANAAIINHDPEARPKARPTVANSKYSPHRCWR
jgi:hypothetical protein